MRSLRPVCGIILSIVFLACCASPQARSILSLPSQQKMVVGETSVIPVQLPDLLENRLVMEILNPFRSVFAAPQDPPVVVTRNSAGYEVTALKPGQAALKIKLLGYIPVKSIAIEAVEPQRVVVGGHSIGVLLQSRGIMVVGFAPVITAQGDKVYPARDQGIEIGDLILSVDGQVVGTETDLAKIIDEKKDSATSFNIRRKDQLITLDIQPVHCPETQRYRIGLYVRDGVVGVGTLTFWDPITRQYAALGHVIMDADTRQGIEVLKGRIVTAAIQTIKPGKPGKPGEKIGIFHDGEIKGDITKNCDFGIFGKTEASQSNQVSGRTVEIGYAHQITTGPAQILTVINGTTVEQFDVTIEKVYPERKNGKGMVIRVVDPRLLTLTGGIVQGMSGSPIIQDGRLIGAVTHVFLNDPQRGYGIFMDNILSEMPVPLSASQTVSTINAAALMASQG